MTSRPLLLAAALLAVSLGACSRSKPDPAPVENGDTEAAATPLSPASDTPDPPNASGRAPHEAADSNAAAEAQPAAPAIDVSTDAAVDVPAAAPADQQVIDDASATGMTSRAARSDRASDNAAARQTEPK